MRKLDSTSKVDSISLTEKEIWTLTVQLLECLKYVYNI